MTAFPSHVTRPPRPSAATMFRRAVRLRCPACGGHPVFTSWTRLCPNCPSCGMAFERGERGYWLGAYFFNLVAVEVSFSLWFAGFLLLTWPDPPWSALQWQITALMLVVPVAFFPYSKTLFLAFDLTVRPPNDDDFAAPHETGISERNRSR